MLPEAVAVRTTVWNLGPAVATHGRYSAQRAERTPQVIRRSDGASYKLHLTASGGVVGIKAGERRLLVRPGEMIVTDLARPGGERSDEASETIVLYLSRLEVGGAAARVARPARARRRGAAGGTAARPDDRARPRGRRAPPHPLPAASAPALARATLQLFAAAVSGAVPRGGEGRGAVENALRRRITWIAWPSKAARDAGNAKATADPRIQAPDPVPFSTARMIYGGFQPMVEA